MQVTTDNRIVLAIPLADQEPHDMLVFFPPAQQGPARDSGYQRVGTLFVAALLAASHFFTPLPAKLAGRPFLLSWLSLRFPPLKCVPLRFS